MDKIKAKVLKRVHADPMNRKAVKDFLFANGIMVEKKDTASQIAHAVYKVFQDSYKRQAQQLKGFNFDSRDAFFHSPQFQRMAFEGVINESIIKGFRPDDFNEIKHFNIKKSVKSVANVVKNTVQAPGIVLESSKKGGGGMKTMWNRLVKEPVVEPAKAVVGSENVGRAGGQVVYGTIGKAIPAIASYASMGEQVENAKVNLINKGSNKTLGTDERTDYGKENAGGMADNVLSIKEGRTVNDAKSLVSDMEKQASQPQIPVNPPLPDDMLKALAEAGVKEENEKENADKKNNMLMYGGLFIVVLIALKFIM